MTPSRFPIMDQHENDIPIYLVVLFEIFPEETTGIKMVAAKNAKNKERVCMVEQSNSGAFRMNQYIPQPRPPGSQIVFLVSVNDQPGPH